MGYTHYWARPPKIDKEVFATIKTEMETALEKLPILIGNGCGNQKFVREKDCVVFNGYGYDDSHETFYFPRETEPESYKISEKNHVFGFCKTARKPYDLAVMVCLLIAKWHLKSKLLVYSDGGAEEWESGFKAYENIFGVERSSMLKAYISLSSDGDFPFLKTNEID